MSPPNETPVMDLITNINAASIEASSLPLEGQILARIAALVAVDAPPASYLMHLGAASEAGVTEDQVQGVMCAIAPIVGTTRIVAAAGKMMRALGLALDLAELEAEAEAEGATTRTGRITGSR
jgi:alkylhydroperoxidase/carboxymuconolactone decarboxylase family protein YurZ